MELLGAGQLHSFENLFDDMNAGLALSTHGCLYSGGPQPHAPALAVS